ncbi:MAG: TetR/AcrR family transcriptional regulator [Lachnospiraceae bacterium]|nr:TetR/AcrR family transcriptional regulator [Lachnospiraceae bacterium]
MSTKDRILEEALTLFAERGYDGTGVDLIAERVGIKGPSLYKHFRSKEEIMNALIDSAEVRYDEFFGSAEHVGRIPDSKESFIRMTMKRIKFTMEDPMIKRIRTFLVQEQFRNERISDVTSRHQTDGIIKMYEKIIKEMMDAGLFREDDPEMLAVEVTAPAVIMIAKADRQPKCKRQMLKGIEKHLRHFCDTYMIDPD